MFIFFQAMSKQIKKYIGRLRAFNFLADYRTYALTRYYLINHFVDMLALRYSVFHEPSALKSSLSGTNNNNYGISDENVISCFFSCRLDSFHAWLLCDACSSSARRRRELEGESCHTISRVASSGWSQRFRTVPWEVWSSMVSTSRPSPELLRLHLSYFY